MKGGITIRSLRLILVLIGVVPILTAGLKDRGKRPGEAREISWEEFEDKVRGGWAGQMIGVTYVGEAFPRARSNKAGPIC